MIVSSGLAIFWLIILVSGTVLLIALVGSFCWPRVATTRQAEKSTKEKVLEAITVAVQKGEGAQILPDNQSGLET